MSAERLNKFNTVRIDMRCESCGFDIPDKWDDHYNMAHDALICPECWHKNRVGNELDSELSCGGDPVPAYKPRTLRNDQLNKEHEL